MKRIVGLVVLALVLAGLIAWLTQSEPASEGVALAPVVEQPRPTREPERAELEPAAPAESAREVAATATEARPPPSATQTVATAPRRSRSVSGRVIARARRTAIAGARVEAHIDRPGGPAAASFEVLVGQTDTAADGQFKLEIPDGVLVQLSAHAPGYAPGFAGITSREGADEAGPTIELDLHGALVVHVGDAAGAPIEGLRVRVFARAADLNRLSHGNRRALGWRHDKSWLATTDHRGDARLDGLMPMPLHHEVCRGDEALRRSTEPVTLAPGEERRIEVRIGAGARISARLVDDGARAVAGYDVWLAHASGDEAERRFHSGEAARARATVTDADGWFAFDDVDPGAWFVGPAAKQLLHAEPDEQLIAPIAQRVEIAPGQRAVQLPDLVRERGLFLTGHVEDAQGQRVPASMYVRGPHGWVESMPAAWRYDFLAGPLTRAEHELYAESGSLARTQTLRAQAGERDLVLRLTGNCTLQVRVVRPGRQTGSRIEMLRDAEGELRSATSHAAGGPAVFQGLDAGIYWLRVRADDRWVGMTTGIAVRDGLNTAEVELAAPASLAIRYAGRTERLTCAIEVDARHWESVQLLRNTPATLAVPAGPIRVRVKADATRPEFSRTAYAEPARTTEIDLGYVD